MYTYTVCVCKLSCECYKPGNNSYAPPIVCSLCTQRIFFKLHGSIVILWGGCSRCAIYQPYLYNCTIKTNKLRHIVYPPTKNRKLFFIQQ